MKHTLLAAVALTASLSLAGPAHALLIDGFGDDQGPITDTTTGDGGLTTGAVAVTDTDLVGVTRTLSVALTTANGGNPSQIQAAIGDGFFSHAQTPGEAGFSLINWTFTTPAVFTDPVGIIIDVTTIDLSADITLSLTDGVNTAMDMVTVNAVGSFTFNFSGFSGLDLSNIVGAALLVDGTASPNLDLELDFIRVPEVAEPGALALVGLGLMGVAASRRRRTV